MSDQYYKEALRLGQKEYRACMSRGESPYLPALDEIVSGESYTAIESLGLVQVPAEFIVGTKTTGRTTAFARNFMPLLEEKSEFAAKWRSLCYAHLQEGIRDSIKVYEYMNRYYVEEGNKRVSVLKFFDAISIAAEVKRILPRRDGDKNVELYYEFVDFYKCSRMNFIEFTKSGSYVELQRLMGKEPDEVWSDEERSRFTTTYYYFRQIYEELGGGKLLTTVGDAMLAYMKVYGYQDLRGKSPAEMRNSITKVWEEITLQQEETPIDVKLTPEEAKKKSLFSIMLSGGEERELKVAFVHDKNPIISGWTYAHELGRAYVQRVFKGRIVTTAYEHAMDGDPLEVIEQAIADGNTTIFTTSPQLLPASLRAAVDHPEVNILNCSLNKSHRYIRTYYARMYEAKFIIGAIAGTLARDGQVGYICDYPIFGQIAGINAFALGMQMVNPQAVVHLEWSSVVGTDAAVRHLTDQGIQLISSQDAARLQEGSRSSFGLYQLEGDQKKVLAMPLWQWGVYYETIIRSILNHSFQTEYQESSKALNYYWGMSAGVVELLCSSQLPDSTRKFAELLERAICSGICNPFRGPLTTQDGRIIDGERHFLSLEQIIRMDWLVDNVVGDIPTYEQLSDEGKATVDIVGVEPATEDR